MTLTSGARLGPYEVVGPIGAGGMGEVYKARDPRLGRDVAIKVLPAAFSADPDRLRRFEQEARAAAALSHTNILALFDIGTYEGAPYLVTELLDGQTLREVLSDSPAGLPVRKSVEWALQIAQGLAAAHGKGIVHRDLKPENLFVTTDGRVKILDFGLAKLTQPDAPAGLGATAMPTTPPNTMAGVVLGTVGYMSPEQVRGLAGDHRMDLFALGVVLYEMLSGRRAFGGETAMDTMTAILKEDPPELPVAERNIPPALVRIVHRCLEKNPAVRFQSASDLAFALEGLSTQSGTGQAAAIPSASLPTRTRASWLVAALATLVALGALTAAVYEDIRRPPVDARRMQFSVAMPDGWALAINMVTPTQGAVAPLSVSPDGRRIAFVARNRDSVNRLWIRPLDSLTAQELPATDGVTSPFWSPDSRFLAFFADGKIKKIDIAGGPPVTICSTVDHRGGTWSRDGIIVFSAGLTGYPLMRVPAAGGVPTPVTTLQKGETGHVRPTFLPDGRHFIYTVTNGGMYIGALDSSDRIRLFERPDASTAMYTQGRLLFMRETTLMAQPFDLGRLALTGEPTPVAEQIQMVGAPLVASFSASDNGVLAYQTGTTNLGQSLTWFDRTGKPLGSIGYPRTYADLVMSPDSKSAAVTLTDAAHGTRDIWQLDLTRGLLRRFTFDPSDDLTPIWSPDGRTIAFASRRRGAHMDLYRKPADSSREEEVLFADDTDKYPSSWSPDGRFILYTANGPSGFDLWTLPLTGDKKPVPFRKNQFSNRPAVFSPDGRWVAYVSNESGANQVYVVPFPGPGGQWQISTTGGTNPRWRDSKELVYATSDGLRAVAVNGAGQSFEVGASTPLFSVLPGGTRAFYDVAPGGQRLLVNALGNEGTQLPPLTVVANWQAGR